MIFVLYTEIRSGLWQELSFVSSVLSAESSSMGLCLKAGTHSPSCCKKYKNPPCFNAALLSFIDSLHILRLAVETGYSLGCDASSTVWVK